jgi:hypothetical protein
MLDAVRGSNGPSKDDCAGAVLAVLGEDLFLFRNTWLRNRFLDLNILLDPGASMDPITSFGSATLQNAVSVAAMLITH